MFILFQVPITDFRSLIDSDNYRLRLPSWNRPSTRSLSEKGKKKEDFIRSFGAAKKRFKGGSKDWVGEDFYCLAEKGIRFEQSFSRKTFGPKEKKIRLDCTFRRFFCADKNRIVSRVELGFNRAEGWNSSLNCPFANSYPTKLNADDILKIVKDILAINVHIHAFDNNHQKRNKEEAAKCMLQHSGELLAKEYLHLTTSHQGLHNSTIKLEEWWVTNGTPMLLIELPKDSLDSGSFFGKDNEGFKYEITQSSLEDLQATKIEAGDSEGLEVWHFQAISINVWIILYDSTIMSDSSKKVQKAKLREIRLHLSRLNAEWECLENVFDQIERNEIAPARETSGSIALNQYLVKSLNKLSKKEYYGISQQGIIGELRKYDPLYQHQNLIQQLEDLDIRPTIIKNTEIFARTQI